MYHEHKNIIIQEEMQINRYALNLKDKIDKIKQIDQ